MQVPEAIKAAVLAETVQTAGVVEAKNTGKPELAEALMVRDAPRFCVAMELKVMVCACALTVKLCETEEAAR